MVVVDGFPIVSSYPHQRLRDSGHAPIVLQRQTSRIELGLRLLEVGDRVRQRDDQVRLCLASTVPTAYG